MSYTLGVSTGTFGIARSADNESRHEFIGLPKKALWSITKGVNFAQVDMESVSEFIEPQLKEKVEALEKMGISIGIHGEAKEYTSTLPFLDCALEEEWHRSHERLIKSLKGAGDVRAKYFLLHSSASMSWQMLWRDLQPTKLADIWGRSLSFFLDKEPEILEWAISKDFVREIIRGLGAPLKEMVEEQIEKMEETWKAKNPEKEIDAATRKKWAESAEKDVKEYLEKHFKRFISIAEETYGSERIAFYVIARWMQAGKSCPKTLRELWNEMTGGGDIEDKNFREVEMGSKWVPAVTAAYTWGHFNPEKCPAWPEKTKPPEDPKPILEKYKLMFVLETPVAGAGEEEQLRLAKPTHIYSLMKRMGTPWAGIAWDAEHQLCGGIDPIVEAKKMPDGAGRLVRVIHTGYPAVLGPAHVPIPLGSEAQEYTYKMLWELKKKGFGEGQNWIIFERGGGQEPVKESILALREIIKCLEKDVPPDKLPDEFFGIPKGGPRWTRQEVSIRDHALDPLKGLLAVPEEEYDFLGTAATAKGKLEEWKKARLR